MNEKRSDDTYRLGSIITGTHSHMCQYPRPLIRDTDDEIVAVVDSCAGPAVVGSLTLSDCESRGWL